MRINRATLSALGTTGVLLAASLTMLALVSALVTFDAWPSRSGAAYASPVAVHSAPAPKLVKAVHYPASVVARAPAGGSRLAAGGGGSGGTGLGGVSAGSIPGGSSSAYVSAPVSYVQQPIGGGGGGGPSVPIGPPPSAPDPAGQVQTAACGALSGVSGTAGGALSGVC
jgi:hypothetical protein